MHVYFASTEYYRGNAAAAVTYINKRKRVVRFTNMEIKKIGEILNNPDRPLKERFRALFTLKNLGGEEAIQVMAKGFDDKSELLKHEVAYCLGQMGDTRAIPILTQVLSNLEQEPIVRHEAGEALGAIGDGSVLPLLIKIRDEDKEEVVIDTCKLAVERLQWLQNDQKQEEKELSTNPYASTDPAPPALEEDIELLKTSLMNEELPLFKRYRAMFALRNKQGDDDSVLALAQGLKSKNALFRHEIAYVLGQIQSPLVTDQLIQCLSDEKELDMVRHECAEALGSIATDQVYEELAKYLDKHQPDVLRESCVVALDFADYNTNPDQFQYADSMSKLGSE